MRGILQLTAGPSGYPKNDEAGLPSYLATWMLRLADRSFAQQAVEVMVELGVTQLELVYEADWEDEAAFLLATLGDGARFGCRVRHWRQERREAKWEAPSEVSPVSVMATLLHDLGDTEVVLMARADRIPLITALPPTRTLPEGGVSITDARTGRETGWRLLSGRALRSVGLRCEPLVVRDTLCSDSVSALMEAQRKVLTGDASPTVPPPANGRRLAAGIYVSRGAVIARSARLKGPCWIASGCRIGADVEIGENVVLSEGCVVEAGTQMNDALALPYTYIGEGLECHEVILDGGTLISGRHSTVVRVPDPFLLSAC